MKMFFEVHLPEGDVKKIIKDYLAGFAKRNKIEDFNITETKAPYFPEILKDPKKFHEVITFNSTDNQNHDKKTEAKFTLTNYRLIPVWIENSHDETLKEAVMLKKRIQKRFK